MYEWNVWLDVSWLDGTLTQNISRIYIGIPANLPAHIGFTVQIVQLKRHSKSENLYAK